MDSINSILGKKSFDEPPEIERLKKYIKNNYGADAVISLSQKYIVVSVNSSSLAASLRLNAPDISRSLKINKKLVFRIH